MNLVRFISCNQQLEHGEPSHEANATLSFLNIGP
jgi:hypothetical protein